MAQLTLEQAFALAVQHRRAGRLREAEGLFWQVLALQPRHVAAIHCLGAIAWQMGQYDASAELMRQAIALKPDVAEAYYDLGNALVGSGKGDEAIAAYRRAISLKPDYASAYNNLGNVMVEMGRIEDAIASFRQAIAFNPNYPEAYNNLGAALRVNGQLEESIAAYRRAIALRPGYVEAHHGLAKAIRFTEGDPRLAAMEKLAANMASLSEMRQIALHFALGKAYADLDQHERAFEHLLKGNALKRRKLRYDESAELARFDRTKAVFTGEFIEQRKGLGDPPELPIFIIGMPRSGTTLIEQTLASHPKVFGAGELWEIAALTTELERDHPPTLFPDVVSLLPPDEWRRLGERFVGRIKPLAPSAERIVDKMPENFRFAGFIHLVLPKARIIHVRRDPVDTCLSCFSHLFPKDRLGWSYDLRELGRYYRAYSTMMEHWWRVLPQGAMLEVQYEEVVADFEAQARRILAFCGLEWDERCMAFHQTQRPVRTASALQVRQPIFKTSVGRGLPYQRMLGPLLEELRQE